MADPDRIDAFIARWSGVSSSERANYQLFITELCSLLDLPQPEPAYEDPLEALGRARRVGAAEARWLAA